MNIELLAKRAYETMISRRPSCSPEYLWWDKQTEACRDDWRAVAQAIADQFSRAVEKAVDNERAICAARAEIRSHEAVAAMDKLAGDILHTNIVDMGRSSP